MAKAIEVNDQAPDFSRPTSDGATVSLKQLLSEKKIVVLYFYPKDNSAICTAQSCSFRDAYEDFKDLNAEVVGISSDSDRSHKDFADKHKLPFHLISDSDGSLRKLYGVPNALGFLPGRVTYVIDQNGKVRMVFNSMLNGQKHIDEALTLVRQLSGKF